MMASIPGFHRTVRGLALAAAASTTFGFAGTALADDPAAAPTSDFKITGSAAVASQYRFRGVSQSNNLPVVQGALTIAHKSGLYVSTWGSSAESNDPTQAANIGGTEIDVFGGWTGPLGKSGLTIDGGLYGYIYPGATGGNYFEIYGSLTRTIGPATVKGGINYGPKQHNFTVLSTAGHDNTYIYGELGGAIPKTPISLHSHFGYTAGALEFTRANLDYTIGVTYTWKNLAFDLSAVGTNVTHASAANASKFVGTFPFNYSVAQEIYRAGKPVPVISVTASF